MTTRLKPNPRRHQYPAYPVTNIEQQGEQYQPHHVSDTNQNEQYPQEYEEQYLPRHTTRSNPTEHFHHSASRSPHRHPQPAHSARTSREKHRVEETHGHHEHADKPASRSKRMKNHFVAATGEFVGTVMFLYFAFAAHSMVVSQSAELPLATGNRGASAQNVVFISLAYGMSLLVTAWGWYRISGGLFNPAVTLGLSLAGQLPWTRALCLIPSQLLGAISAAALVSCMFPGSISSVNTTLFPGVSIVQGVFIEMFLTSLLIFVVLMLAIEKSKDTFIAPIGIGLTLFVAELAGVSFTGGSLNPARSFGPAVAGGEFVGYHWIYWVGPALGAFMSAGYYRFVKYFDYEEANPGQDSSGGAFK